MAKAASTAVSSTEDSNMLPFETRTMKELNSLFAAPERDYVPESVEDLEAAWEQAGGVIMFQGSPWDVVTKDVLEGVPFTIHEIRFYDGTYGSACAVTAITDKPVVDESPGDGKHVVFNDGSSGVFAQCLAAVKRANRRGGFRCPKGLRASHYEYVEKDFDGNPVITEKTGEPKKPTPATTWYIG